MGVGSINLIQNIINASCIYMNIFVYVEFVHLNANYHWQIFVSI